MAQLNTYYRPVWTCGRYNEKAQATIYYNLITGVSYYFESYSAKVIGEILSTPRNHIITIENISKKLNISIESLNPFFEELEQLGLLSTVIPTTNIISEYRRRVSAYNCQQAQINTSSIQDKIPYLTSNAERFYTNKVGGITSVMFELTYNCSEKCIHCYNEGATRNDNEKSLRGKREELTFEDYKH